MFDTPVIDISTNSEGHELETDFFQYFFSINITKKLPSILSISALKFCYNVEI